MPVQQVYEIGHGRRRGSWRRGRKRSDTPIETYVRKYRVVCDETNDTAETVLEANALPQMGDAYPNNPRAKVVNRSADETEDAFRWEVQIEYSTEGPENDSRVSWSTERYAKPYQKDANGEVVANSAYDNFEPPLERQRGHLVMTVEKDVAAALFDPVDLINNYLFHTNSDEFYDFEAGTVWFADFSGKEDVRNGVDIVNATYTFHIRDAEIGWHDFPLDAGYRILDLAANPPGWRPIRDRGQLVSQPVPLDGLGGRLAPGNPVVYLDYQPYFEADFNDLGLF